MTTVIGNGVISNILASIAFAAWVPAPLSIKSTPVSPTIKPKLALLPRFSALRLPVSPMIAYTGPSMCSVVKPAFAAKAIWLIKAIEMLIVKASKIHNLR